jgi:hypothetical protein
MAGPLIALVGDALRIARSLPMKDPEKRKKARGNAELSSLSAPRGSSCTGVVRPWTIRHSVCKPRVSGFSSGINK